MRAASAIRSSEYLGKPGGHNAHAPNLNGICPYFTMFPISFPLRVLSEVGGYDIGEIPSDVQPAYEAASSLSPGTTQPLGSGPPRGGWVLDPFCGRGTTNLAARMLGIPSLGIDISPIAVAIAEAKSVSPSPEEVIKEAEEILSSPGEPGDVPQGEFWELVYHSEVLRQLCKFREALLSDCASPARIALRGIILGALHGPRTKKVPSYFSNQAPRTFAPKPKYSVSFWKKHGLLPPRVDVLEIIRTRARRYYGCTLPGVKTWVISGDSSDESIVHVLEDFRSSVGTPCSLVITSPPYFGMSTYVADQWLRNWFLGGPAQVEYRTRDQLARGSVHEYVERLSRVWRNVGKVCERGSRMVVRFGSISSSPIDTEAVFGFSLTRTGWEIFRKQSAGESPRGKRQAAAFCFTRASAASEIDFYCIKV